MSRVSGDSCLMWRLIDYSGVAIPYFFRRVNELTDTVSTLLVITASREYVSQPGHLVMRL